MRDIFKGYYRPSEDEFNRLWAESFFVFDANVLLNLYRYSIETRNSLLAIIIALKDRCWIPYQAALEFHENRLEVIVKQIAAYTEFKSTIIELQEKLNKKGSHPFFPGNVLQQWNTFVQKALGELDGGSKQLQDLFESDLILDAIDDAFAGGVGSKFAEAEELSVRNEGEDRFKRRIPPGYKDQHKDGPRRYSDLLIWKQIIHEAKSRGQSAILVTDDKKEDWWRIVNGGRTIGPRPELVDEFRREVGMSFYMYTADRFMELASDRAGQSVEAKSVEEVREVAEQSRQEACEEDAEKYFRGIQASVRTPSGEQPEWSTYRGIPKSLYPGSLVVGGGSPSSSVIAPQMIVQDIASKWISAQNALAEFRRMNSEVDRVLMGDSLLLRDSLVGLLRKSSLRGDIVNYSASNPSNQRSVEGTDDPVDPPPGNTRLSEEADKGQSRSE